MPGAREWLPPGSGRPSCSRRTPDPDAAESGERRMPSLTQGAGRGPGAAWTHNQQARS